MKKYSEIRRLAAGALLLLTSSCEKVVVLDLQSTAPRLTIEADLADAGQPCTVRLAQSVDYTQTNAFPAVSGAVITLSDNAGNRETLQATATPGQYRGRTLLGQGGRTYTLRVEANGGTYVAVATLPAAVAFTGLHVDTTNTNNRGRLTVVPEFLDPSGVRNYYLYRTYHNGRLSKDFSVQSDEFTDGKANVRGVNLGGGDDDADSFPVVSGDSIRIEMRNLDPAVYEYYRTLSQILRSNPLFSTSPANPKSNFSGNALGYFSAHSSRQRTIIAP